MVDEISERQRIAGHHIKRAFFLIPLCPPPVLHPNNVGMLRLGTESYFVLESFSSLGVHPFRKEALQRKLFTVCVLDKKYPSRTAFANDACHGIDVKSGFENFGVTCH